MYSRGAYNFHHLVGYMCSKRSIFLQGELNLHDLVGDEIYGSIFLQGAPNFYDQVAGVFQVSILLQREHNFDDQVGPIRPVYHKVSFITFKNYYFGTSSKLIHFPASRLFIFLYDVMNHFNVLILTFATLKEPKGLFTNLEF